MKLTPQSIEEFSTPGASHSRPSDPAGETYRGARREHWDEIAKLRHDGWGAYYHHRLSEIYRFLVPPGQRVLEIGCGKGDLLASLRPSTGTGIDFSEEMIRLARERHPELTFHHADIHDLRIQDKFDVIILSDLVNDLWDVQSSLENIRRMCSPQTRLILNTYSRLWEPALALAQKMGLAHPTLYQNWLTVPDLINLLNLADFQVIRKWQEILWPLRTPLLASLGNRFLVKLPFFRHLALANFLIAWPAPGGTARENPSVSIVIPARNEAGNIKQIFQRVPRIGSRMELIFVEGHSRDGTYETIEAAIASQAGLDCKLIRQTGIGKGDAVRLGFENASGDVLMILDADLTVQPEDLPRFFDVLASGRAELVNGVRQVYPMEKHAMNFFNLVGNKAFTLAFTWLLGQPVRDTLCGTKVLWKKDYKLIAETRSYLGDMDPFGDFDLLFGAARWNRKIVDMPVRYRERTYGSTNIKRWSHGWMLLKMVFRAARKIKFV